LGARLYMTCASYATSFFPRQDHEGCGPLAPSICWIGPMIETAIIAATNRKFEEEVAAKRFREDLYYRLSGLQIELLPLRDARRAADIRALLLHHLAKQEDALKKRTLGVTRGAQTALMQFRWPGNVRQLINVCLRLVTHAAPGSWIDIADIRHLQ